MRAMLLVLAACTVFGTAASHHCETWGTSEPEVTLCQGDPTPCVYVDNDLCQMGCVDPWNVWVYEETNGIEGLQRKDATVNDTCHGAIAPDALIANGPIPR